jgi:hypothetical protein
VGVYPADFMTRSACSWTCLAEPPCAVLRTFGRPFTPLAWRVARRGYRSARSRTHDGADENGSPNAREHQKYMRSHDYRDITPSSSKSCAADGEAPNGGASRALRGRGAKGPRDGVVSRYCLRIRGRDRDAVLSGRHLGSADENSLIGCWTLSATSSGCWRHACENCDRRFFHPRPRLGP